MKKLLPFALFALTIAAQVHAKVRFDYQSDQRTNPVGQTVISMPFTLEDTGNIAAVVTTQFSTLSTTIGQISGDVLLDGDKIGSFVGTAAMPQVVFTGTTMAHGNDVDAGDHILSVKYKTWLNAGPPVTMVLLIVDDGDMPVFYLGETQVSLEEYLNYLQETLLVEIDDRFAADQALQEYIDGIRAILEERIALLEADIDYLYSQLENFDPQALDDLRTELIAYIDNIKTLLETRISGLEQQLADLTIDVDANSQLILQVQSVLQANMDALQTTLESRITNLELQLAALAAQNNANGDLIVQVRSDLELAITNLQQLFETRISQLESLVTTLQQNGEANAELIAQLQAALAQLSNTVTAFQSSTEARFAGLDGVDADLQGQIDALRDQVASHQSNLDGRITALENQLASLPVATPSGDSGTVAHLSAVDARLSAVESRLNGHDQRLKNVGSHDGDGPDIGTYLIPAGIGIGTSVLVNALWPIPVGADDDEEKEQNPTMDDPKAMASTAETTVTK